ncbi:MAG: 2-aminoethylphosphonate--pyruvate transaminase [Rhodospirillales bacterium]|jgi:2-aminoethylphosphonate-pyruvate transaminase|nr:2-aminoethylphosphonate--pyruvate transaminase [Rhodospirillales bacterium]MDP6804402.1 2-aminoethylphosphonate--pyruvate transaminase [Rhodospirillales bacterium]
MDRDHDAPILLTPGPLTTSAEVRGAMRRDWGSRDADFIALTARVRERLLSLVDGERTHVCVPVQGSGTFAIEATIGTLVPRNGKALVLVNGAYGRRMVLILERMGRAVATLEAPEDGCHPIAALDAMLAGDEAISHVLAVHCETTSGILNRIDEIAAAAAARGRGLVIDAMSSFGGIPIDARDTPFDALVAASGKCLEGVPGLGIALVRRDALAACAGNAHSLSLDLYDQWESMERSGQWRFTPPTHVLAALSAALDALEAEGGVEKRHARYQRNCRALIEGMREMGFETVLANEVQAPIVVTFHAPADPRFRFDSFYAAMRSRGFAIYPGKLTEAESFRIGCIGNLDEAVIRAALAAVREAIAEMGLESCGRRAA